MKNGTDPSHLRIPILVGPTGVGKSETAFHLALRLKAEIISADAFQVYQGMEIGTAQPPLNWREQVPHHLVGVREPTDEWNAAEFARAAKTIIDQRTVEGKRVLVVGGAGFYIKALVEGLPPGAAPSAEIRAMVAGEVQKIGNEKAHEWLEKRDPQAASRIHLNDGFRISRALEKTYDSTTVSPDFSALGGESVSFIGLERSRENLDQRLRIRTQSMWDKGLLYETEVFIKKGISHAHPLFKAIGYFEAFNFLMKKMTSEEAIERIFRRTRQYAKRQWTWFKHQHTVCWINLDNFPDISSVVNELEKIIKGG
ncbi:MAG TPA: tRNA (adenosine(37)-N6)-dimethylallyltransferase MiaA [bacterium]